jgi:hypothetical protein
MGEPEQNLVAYTRVSTRQQGVSGLGLEAQDVAIAAHVKATGATLIAAFTERSTPVRSPRVPSSQRRSRAVETRARCW